MGMFSDLKKLEQSPAAPTPKAEPPVNTAPRKPVQPQTHEYGNTAIREPVHLATALDINDRAEVKQTYNCSANEAKAMRRLLWELDEQYGIIAGKQDIQRSGIHMVIEDFVEKGRSSTIVKILKKKR